MTSLRLVDAARFTDRDNPEPHQIDAWNDFQKGVSPEQVEAFFRAFRAAPLKPVAVPASQNPAVKALLQFIYSGEGGYTSVNRGSAGDTPGGVPGLTSMTIGEIKKAQAAGRLFAVGAAQFIPSTLPIAQEAARLPDSAPFSAENQDRLATALLLGGKRPSLAAYLLGRSDDLDTAQIDMAKEWASVPLPSGRGFYDGDSAGNQATKKAAAVRAALIAAREGITGVAAPIPSLNTPAQQSAVVTKDSPFATRLTPNFTYGEFALNQEARRFTQNYQVATAIELAQFLEKLRTAFGGKPVTITSGYRPPAVNRQTGGASQSEHLYDAPSVGAVDVLVVGEPILKVQQWIDKNWPYSVGHGAPKGFVHVGIRLGRPRIRWDY